jgi:hypothetical protein
VASAEWTQSCSHTRERISIGTLLRLGRVLFALTAAVHNENVRHVEFAWGAAVAAEWAYFVALGVFAVAQGSRASPGFRPLRWQRRSLGDRFARERFLPAVGAWA